MTPLPLAFVLHANQFIITDGYADRDGISKISVGFDAILSRHVELGIPANLHISGPLLESLAWHRPAALRRLISHLDSGIITLIGGTYGENIMPMTSPEMNRRQLRAYHELVEELLGVDRKTLRTAWVPERVWDTDTCTAPLLDEAATGVRYERVLIDDRLRLPLEHGRYHGSERAAFDAAGPYEWHSQGFPDNTKGLLQPDLLVPYRIAGAGGLTAVPLASHLRYLIPPHDPSHLRLLAELVNDGAWPQAPEGSLLVFADDLERVAGVGGWEPALERYSRLLDWLAKTAPFDAVGLDAWLDGVTPDAQTEVASGCYFELAHHHGAGENYGNWANDPRWRPYAQLLEHVEEALLQAEAEGADPGLCWLAERLLMLGQHETAWQDPDPGNLGRRSPAPWARATAAHAADALPLLEAARWVNRPEEHGPRVLLGDIDADGSDELIVVGGRLFAVFSPDHGGRLTLLVSRQLRQDGSFEGVVLVGNPADHWNFQEELHQYMEQPPNHPGALGVSGTETHRHELSEVEVIDRTVVVELTDVEPGTDEGLTKRILLDPDAGAIVMCVERPTEPGELRTFAALSPDYAGLLRAGRSQVTLFDGETWRGLRQADVAAWVGHEPSEHTSLFHDANPLAGHAVVSGVEGCGRHLHVVLGTGPTDAARVAGLIEDAAELLHGRPLAGYRRTALIGEEAAHVQSVMALS